MTSKKPKIQTQIIGKDGINPIFLLAVIIVLSVTIRLYYFPTDIPITFDGIDISAMQLTQSVSIQQIPNKSRTMVMISFVAGFFLSIFLALMMNLFKEDETEPTTKTSR